MWSLVESVASQINEMINVHSWQLCNLFTLIYIRNSRLRIQCFIAICSGTIVSVFGLGRSREYDGDDSYE